jgi:hypothetical protein
VLPILLLAGGGAYLFLSGSSETVQAEETRIEQRGIVPFETFLVNLTDPGGNRFLKCTLQLVFCVRRRGQARVRKPRADGAHALGHSRTAHRAERSGADHGRGQDRNSRTP